MISISVLVSGPGLVHVVVVAPLADPILGQDLVIIIFLIYLPIEGKIVRFISL